MPSHEYKQFITPQSAIFWSKDNKSVDPNRQRLYVPIANLESFGPKVFLAFRDKHVMLKSTRQTPNPEAYSAFQMEMYTSWYIKKALQQKPEIVARLLLPQEILQTPDDHHHLVYPLLKLAEDSSTLVERNLHPNGQKLSTWLLNQPHTGDEDLAIERRTIQISPLLEQLAETLDTLHEIKIRTNALGANNLALTDDEQLVFLNFEHTTITKNAISRLLNQSEIDPKTELKYEKLNYLNLVMYMIKPELFAHNQTVSQAMQGISNSDKSRNFESLFLHHLQDVSQDWTATDFLKRLISRLINS